VGRRVGLEREQFARCFGINLAKARNAADVSQDELAFRTSTHRTAISQIERGLSLPGLDSAMRFAAALEMSLDELVAGIEWQSPEMQIGKFKIPNQEENEPQRPKNEG
jgi:transcriptional regulator with XRE-family HTH domain